MIELRKWEKILKKKYHIIYTYIWQFFLEHNLFERERKRAPASKDIHNNIKNNLQHVRESFLFNSSVGAGRAGHAGRASARWYPHSNPLFIGPECGYHYGHKCEHNQQYVADCVYGGILCVIKYKKELIKIKWYKHAIYCFTLINTI